jgi:hypothetical protein
MFLSMLTLQYTQDHGWLWWLSGAGLFFPAWTAGILTLKKSKVLPGPAAEKIAILFLCGWLIAWSLG